MADPTEALTEGRAEAIDRELLSTLAAVPACLAEADRVAARNGALTGGRVGVIDRTLSTLATVPVRLAEADGVTARNGALADRDLSIPL
ncbi:MAG TPA: hypothetical protein VLF94_01435, partial [Chlamydiales bacterium]|nr:hypothetical protein [Chlamydiales bacterium]